MDSFVIRGNFCDSENKDTIRIRPNACLVCENGICTGIFDELPERYAALPLTDYGDTLILPGMTDLHIHAPQFSYRGLGMELELLDWLETYTFPEEAKYADLTYAERAYGQFADHLRRSYTTRAAVFATIHVPATMLLMEQMDKTGLISYIGKVNMNRNCPDDLREVDVPTALADTERWLCETGERFAHTKPIITPRFIPSCTDELMRGLRTLVEKYHVPVQSHLSENLREIALVQELCPDSKFYGDAYDRFGLFGGDHPCIMAHCVHSGEEERRLIKKNGVFIAHSPFSNTNVASGVAPISAYLDDGIATALASDVAGGHTENMLRVMVGAIQASNLRWRLLDQNVKKLTVDQAFYIATVGGGAFFGKVGKFEAGYEFDAVVLDDRTIEHPQELSLRARLDRSIYLADERHIKAKYVAGNRLF